MPLCCKVELALSTFQSQWNTRLWIERGVRTEYYSPRPGVQLTYIHRDLSMPSRSLLIEAVLGVPDLPNLWRRTGEGPGTASRICPWPCGGKQKLQSRGVVEVGRELEGVRNKCRVYPNYDWRLFEKPRIPQPTTVEMQNSVHLRREQTYKFTEQSAVIIR